MKFYPLTVRGVIDETHNARSFLLEPRPEHTALFEYKSGQFLTFRVPWEGTHLERCYSLSNAPTTEPDIKVTVKRVDGGPVSNWFNDELKPGDVVDTAPPSGRFILRSTQAPMLLFAGGSGITPVISLIKSALYTASRSIRLLYANRNRDSIIFHREIQQLCTEFSHRFDCQHHLDEESGLLGARVVDTFLRSVGTDTHVYICGPEPFMNTVETVVDQRCIDTDNVFIERFTISEDEGTEVEPAVVTITAPADVTMFRATLDGKVHEVPYANDQTLLECMLSAGLDPLYSCQDAHCGTCMVIKKNGDVAMRKTRVLSKRDMSRGYILLCQAIPQSKDVWVDCDE